MSWTRTALMVLVAAGLGAAGCARPFTPPMIPVPDRYAHAPDVAGTDLRAMDWWKAMDDPGLDAAVRAALTGNRDLAEARVRVRRARLLARLAGLDQWPSLSGDLSGTRTGSVSSYNANLAVTFDPDPWRRLAATTSAAKQTALAAGQDADAARIALITTACGLYWDIGFTHQQIDTARATLEDQQRILRLVQTQQAFGQVSSLEVAEAGAAIAQQTTALAALVQHLVEDRAAVSILIGAVAPPDRPGAGEALTLPATLPPEVPAGLPADLIARRPDLRAAEMRMRASWDSAEAVRTSVYPDIVLTAAGGASSPSLGRLLDHPISSVLAAVSLPFLDLPRHRLNTAVARVDTELAELGFRIAVYRALGDVDNALSSRTQLMAQRVSLQTGLAASTRAEQLYGVRYRSGSVALRVWLEAQQSRRTARLALDANGLALLQNRATLSAALGDGARDLSGR
jgi:NodT family efflux transporter outer membrane factor (OMF) lipoprotein